MILIITSLQLRVARSVRRHKEHLWPGGIVRYKFSEDVAISQQENIRKAMEHIENRTCIRFIPDTPERPYRYTYVLYTNKPNCFVGSVGKKREKGPQEVNLGPGCGYRAALHEIGHALGMWHEVDRPDRDDYLRYTENVPPEKRGNFPTRQAYYIDSRGIPYDYDSVMGGIPWQKVNGLPAFEISNLEWYKAQGSPFKASERLSNLDAMQLNRMYNCPGSGVQGRLRIHIGQAENLQTSSNVFVQVTAVNDSRMEEVQTTRSINGTGSPNWDEWLEFGEGSWQYIEINIVQDDGVELINDKYSEVYSINPGNHTYRVYHPERESKNLTFSTYLLDYECPCLNGGSCYIHSPLVCVCTEDFVGPRCEYPAVKLVVYVSHGENLRNRDRLRWDNVSDPFLRIQAYENHGRTILRRSKVIKDNLNPVWNQTIELRSGPLKYFAVDVWDDDSDLRYPNNRLSTTHRYNLTSFTPETIQNTIRGFEGFVYFSYTYTY